MKRQCGWSSDQFLLLAILITAAVLRLCCLASIPFMHDEFSALFRTGYGSFAQLMEKGVKPDAHPPGAQLIIASVAALAGWNEFWIKLPFALMGLFSVALVFGIARKLFNLSSAFFASSIVAASQFFVFYSEIARPYSPGLFFLLLAAYAATQFVDHKNQPSRPFLLLFAVSLMLAATMHYFAMLMAGFLFLGWSWVLGKKQWKQSLGVGLLAILLFLPNLPIMLSQVSAGGIGDWLGKPSNSFLTDFFAYNLHYSWIVAASILLFLFIGFSTKPLFQKFKMQWIVVFISSFALSFGIGLSYSLLRTPVIQFSSLYFSFPFFILGISGFMRPLKSRLNSLMVVLLLGVFMFSLVFERKHFWLMQHQGYEQIALNFAQNRASYGDEVTLVAVGGSERMLDFYQQKYAVKGAHIFNKDRSMAEFANLVDSCKTPWFAIGWTDYSNFQWVDYVHSRYPVQLASQNWFNSAYYLFGSNQNNVQTDTDSEKTYLSEQSFSGIKDFKENDEFGLLWEIAADSALKPYSGIWVAGIELIAESTLENAALVMEVKDQNLQQAALWRAGTLNERRIAAGDTTCIVVAYHLDSGPPFKPDALLRLYVWNKGQERFKVSRRWFYVKKHDPILFGLYEPF